MVDGPLENEHWNGSRGDAQSTTAAHARLRRVGATDMWYHIRGFLSLRSAPPFIGRWTNGRSVGDQIVTSVLALTQGFLIAFGSVGVDLIV